MPTLFCSSPKRWLLPVDGKISAELPLPAGPKNIGLYLLMEELRLTLLCLSIQKTMAWEEKKGDQVHIKKVLKNAFKTRRKVSQ